MFNLTSSSLSEYCNDKKKWIKHIVYPTNTLVIEYTYLSLQCVKKQQMENLSYLSSLPAQLQRKIAN